MRTQREVLEAVAKLKLDATGHIKMKVIKSSPPQMLQKCLVCGKRKHTEMYPGAVREAASRGFHARALVFSRR
jgi:hypothetical protein